MAKKKFMKIEEVLIQEQLVRDARPIIDTYQKLLQLRKVSEENESGIAISCNFGGYGRGSYYPSKITFNLFLDMLIEDQVKELKKINVTP